jgi:hypothetical protein
MHTITRRKFAQLIALVTLGLTGRSWSQPASFGADTADLAPTADTIARGNPLWVHVPDMSIRQGQTLCLKDLLKDVDDERITLWLNSVTLPHGITYDPASACLSAAADAQPRIITGLVVVAEDGR